MMHLGLLAGLLALAAPAQALADIGHREVSPDEAGSRERQAEPVHPLVTLLSDADYPAEAIAKREEGRVRFRLSVDAEGRVDGCSILSSSGSAALDTASCQLLGGRARFHPAVDQRGVPVRGSHEGAIRWVLSKHQFTSAIEIAYQTWIDCALAESEKHVGSELSLTQVTRKAFASCRKEEMETARNIGTELGLIPVRNSIRRAIALQLSRGRAGTPR